MNHLAQRTGGMGIKGAAGVLYNILFIWFFFLTCFISSGTASAEVFISEGNYQTSCEGVLLVGGGIAVDRDGNIFVADSLNYVIRSYLPDGTPLQVFGREFVSGNADGFPVDARFLLPGHLAADPDGNILVADGHNLIRRIDAATLMVTTVADLSAGVDGTQLYDVRTGLTANKGALSDLVIGDLAVRPNGDIFVAAADHLGVVIYLVRISGNEKKGIAYSELINPSATTWARGVAVDAQGDVFAQMPGMITPGGGQPDYIYRFPGGVATQVVNIGIPSRISRDMTAGNGNRLYLSSEVITDPVVVISSTNAAATISTLDIVQTFPQVPSQSVHETAVAPDGTVYAVNSRSLDSSGVPSTNFAKVDRFTGIDVPIGQQAGDTELPEVILLSPTARQLVVSPVTLRATASDNSGTVQVQFRIDGKIFGPSVTTPPFERLLDPSLLPDGNHDITVVARDPAGNARTSAPIIFRTAGGFPNLDGELFAADRQLTSPVGIATDNTGDVYVADVTKILRFSPAGTLVATYGSDVSARVDGGAAQVRFGRLKGLGRDQAGRILILDDIDDVGDLSLSPPRIRRLDPITGITETVLILDEDADIDVGNVYNVTTGEFEDLIASSPLCQFIPCDFGVNKTYDLTAAPNGDILISASDGYGPDFDSYTYLIRHSASGNRALARSTALYSIMEPDMGARGVAVDSAGGIIASFPAAGDYGIVDHNILERFPANFPSSPAGLLLDPLAGDGGLAVDSLNRLLVTLDAGDTLPGRVDMLPLPGATQPFRQLARRILDQAHDVAVDGAGNVYVTSTEFRFLDKIYRTVSRVTRFGAAALPQSPRLVSGFPEAGAVDVALNSQIRATFNEDMDATTITNSTFFLDNGVSGTISYDAGSRTATLTPPAGLSPNTTYIVTLTTGIRDTAGNSLASDKTWVFTTTDHVKLSVTIGGEGSGSVHSAPPGISMSEGESSYLFTAGNTVYLTATVSSGSRFSGWFGNCSGLDLVCSLVMNADKNVTATFDQLNSVRIKGNPPVLYQSFDTAYGVASNGAVIEMQADDYIGDIILNRVLAFTIMGGYDSSFSSLTGRTVLRGKLFIRKGSVMINRVAIR